MDFEQNFPALLKCNFNQTCLGIIFSLNLDFEASIDTGNGGMTISTTQT